MSRALVILVLGLMVAAGCGSTGDAGGGAANLPVSGAGPFRPLPPNQAIPITPPFVLLDPLADVDEPSVVADGDALALWVTAKRKALAGTRIEHADAFHLTDGFGPLTMALDPDQGWEAGALSSPSVIWDQPWILFYGGGGAIGWATAADGHTWVKAPGPALVANNAEEGTALSSPAAVRVGDRLRVYYLASGAVWAAEAPFADVAASRATTWARLDGDPTTPERDPILAPAGHQLVTSTMMIPVVAIEHVSARAARRPPAASATISTSRPPPAPPACRPAASPARSPAIASPCPPRRSCRSCRPPARRPRPPDLVLPPYPPLWMKVRFWGVRGSIPVPGPRHEPLRRQHVVRGRACGR